MADLISIIGTAGAIANIIDMLTKTVSTVYDMRQEWKIADLIVLTFENQLNLLKTALSQIQKWATSSEERDHDIIMQVDNCVTCCRLLISKIDIEVSQFERTIDGDLNLPSKLALLFKSKDMEQIQRMIDQQTYALTLLLSACTANAIEDQRKVLQQPEAIQVFQQMDRDTASLIVHRDSDSIITATSASSSKWSVQFAFDSELFITRVYDRWIRKLATIRNGDISQQPDTPQQENLNTLNRNLPNRDPPDGSEQHTFTQTHNISKKHSQLSLRLGERITKSLSLKRSRLSVMVPVLGSTTRKGFIEGMKLANGDQCYTEEQSHLFRPIIIASTIQSAKYLSEMLLHSLPMAQLEPIRTQLRSILEYKRNPGYDVSLGPELVKTISQVRDHPATKAWMEAEDLLLPGNGKFFLEEVDRISSEEYVPSDLDVITCPTPLPGGLEFTIEPATSNFDGDIRMIDPGNTAIGSEACLALSEKMVAIIFVFDLGTDVQFLPNHGNGLLNTMAQFEAVVGLPLSRNSSIIVLLTNFDIFKKNLLRVPLTRWFPDYEGENDPSEAANFILSKLEQASLLANLDIFPHLIEGVFSKKIFRQILKEIISVYISKALERIHL